MVKILEDLFQVVYPEAWYGLCTLVSLTIVTLIHSTGPRALTGLFMFLSPRGSVIVYIGKMHKKSKYAILTNLTVAVFPK